MDTNVPVVANGRTSQASPDCVLACIDALLRIRENCLLLDDGGLILDEYRRYLSPSGQPGSGDAFFKWLWNNQGNADQCRRVKITADDDRGFAEFPDDPELERFDKDDRKFVAVALASGNAPPVLNASDTDWWNFREVLSQRGVRVDFICQELMTGTRASRGSGSPPGRRGRGSS
jgi:hypothetical protein